MATVRQGNAPVLLVVDVQVGVMRTAWEAPRVIRNVSRAVERARAEGVPVLWVQHADDERRVLRRQERRDGVRHADTDQL